jgi:ADP-ribose pyrophosphatase YjhB (NUDIX family)
MREAICVNRWLFLLERNVTKEEILAAIRECAEKLGRSPSYTELQRTVNVTRRSIRKHCVTYTHALRECGLERQGCGRQLQMDALFQDWAGIVRKVGKAPTVAEYEMHSKFSVQPLFTRFGSWRQAHVGMLEYAQEQGLADEWSDVLRMVRAGQQKGRGAARNGLPLKQIPAPPKIMRDRPTYGPPLTQGPLAHGPINEAGVVYLFGVLAARLGFVVMRIQTEFPDCEAMRQVDEGVWQKVRIEFEYESRNFLKHLHRAEDCDLIVCWTHNWPKCPLEVVELRGVIG